jgi:hypothetical protein
MSVQWVMPNGEVVPVPRDVVSQGKAAEQAFYDAQLARLEAEAKDSSVKDDWR